MIDSAVTISVADDADRAWAAELMAASEPWIRLGRGYEECLAAVRPGPDALMFVARSDGGPIGFALTRARGVAGSPYLVSIGVDPEHRGRGVGTCLLAHLEDHYRATARHMFLCVSSFNGAARRMYERSGYGTVGEFPDYVVDGASEVLMHKRLDRP